MGSVSGTGGVNGSRGNGFKESKQLWHLRSCTGKTPAKATLLPNRTHVSGREEGDLAEAVFNVCTKAHSRLQALWGTVARMKRCPRPVSIQSPEERHD